MSGGTLHLNHTTYSKEGLRGKRTLNLGKRIQFGSGGCLELGKMKSKPFIWTLVNM